MQRKVRADWNGLKVVGEVHIGDWEGDPSIPRGIHHLPPYVEDIEVLSPEEDDITDYLTEDALEEVREAILEGK